MTSGKEEAYPKGTHFTSVHIPREEIAKFTQLAGLDLIARLHINEDTFYFQF